MDCIRYTKIGLSLLSAITFTIITVSLYDKIPIGIIISSLICLYILCGIVIFDNSSIIRMLKKEADRLTAENDRLTKLNDSFGSNIDQLNGENRKYKDLNDQHNKNIIKLDNQLKESKAINMASQKQLDEYKVMFNKLTEINLTNETLIKTQKNNIEKLNQQIDVATNNNIILSGQVKKFESLTINLKTIITTMANSIDQSNGLATELGQSIDKVQAVSHDIQRSADLMNRIITGISHMKFDQLDLDDDGQISKSEWQKTVLIDDWVKLDNDPKK